MNDYVVERVGNVLLDMYRMAQCIPDQVSRIYRLTGNNDTDYLDNLRMDMGTFARLCYLLHNVGGLCDSKHVRVEEKMETFYGMNVEIALLPAICTWCSRVEAGGFRRDMVSCPGIGVPVHERWERWIADVSGRWCTGEGLCSVRRTCAVVTRTRWIMVIRRIRELEIGSTGVVVLAAHIL
ncbi:hypothetical protein BUALT_Bualt13G0036200 [Buddleja alternifolia]|uniref:DUF8040 domain-containing protein n=1 Tax=Buddleja alternifolia TaxID=168488 RepID=A0AAV6WR72_9LAMI|nr:hypothetical protein BUALT_Bualt13G0036200 [Buddleja alternifolia]